MPEKKICRPKVTGVTIDLVYPDGKARTITIDPNQVEAIFWSERAVKEILAPYYEKQQPEYSKDDYIKTFGDIAPKLFSSQDKVKFDKKTVEKLWNTEDNEGCLPALLRKSNKCIPI